MGDEFGVDVGSHEPIRVVHVESAPGVHNWWPVWMVGVTAALVGAVALTFTLITTVQRADRAERRAFQDFELEECRNLFAAEITETQQTSDNALNELVVLITRQIMATNPPVQDQFVMAIDRLESTDQSADAALQRRDEWLVDGSPLPCPVSAED